MKAIFFTWLRIDAGYRIKLYTGFANDNKCTVYGHVLAYSPMSRKNYRNHFFFNTLALIRLFIVSPVQAITVKICLEGNEYDTKTEKDGFFILECPLPHIHMPGQYPVSASIYHQRKNTLLHTAIAEFIIPDKKTFSCISDIDDTFLISHSGNLRKRLYVLFTKNARSRRPFDGAVEHYKLLSNATDHYRSFFYVSSSEWNLYGYIREFVSRNQLPEGVFLLNQIKTFSKLFATGQGNHQGKFTRIVKILEFFPEEQFILLGDDSQRDPYIYESVVKHFPKNVLCVYIRRVREAAKPEVTAIGEIIMQAGVQFLYFAHSQEAIEHSLQQGFVSSEKAINKTV